MAINKMIIMVAFLVISMIMIGKIGCLNVYADEAESPVTLTKEAVTDIDCREIEKQAPNTGDTDHTTAAACVIAATGIIGAITVGTTAASHKNT